MCISVEMAFGASAGDLIAVGVSIGGLDAWVGILTLDLHPVAWTNWRQVIGGSGAQPDSHPAPGTLEGTDLVSLWPTVLWVKPPDPPPSFRGCCLSQIAEEHPVAAWAHGCPGRDGQAGQLCPP